MFNTQQLFSRLQSRGPVLGDRDQNPRGTTQWQVCKNKIIIRLSKKRDVRRHTTARSSNSSFVSWLLQLRIREQFLFRPIFSFSPALLRFRRGSFFSLLVREILVPFTYVYIHQYLIDLPVKLVSSTFKSLNSPVGTRVNDV